MTTTSPYAARVRFIELLERERAQDTLLRVYRDGNELTPTAGTYSLYKGNGDAVISAAVVDLASGYAQYAHTAGSLPDSLQFAEGYLQEWSLTIAGDVHIFRRPAAIVRRRLYPVISDIDLKSYYSDLDNVLPPSLAATGYQTYIDNAWYDLLQRISGEGILVYLILSPSALRLAHLHMCLAYIFRDFTTTVGQDSRWMELYQEHSRQAEIEYKRINFLYDLDNDGKNDSQTRRRASATIYTNGAPSKGWTRRARSSRWR